MDTEDIDVNEAESSTSAEVPENPDVEAQSSSAEGEQAVEESKEADAEVTLQDIVAETVKDSREKSISEEDEEPPASEDQEPEAKAAEEVPDNDDDDQQVLDELEDLGFSDEELKALKNKTRERFNSLLAERSEYKGKAEELDVISGFMQENSISSDDMSRAMGMLAHFNAGNYSGFLDGIQPMMEKAGQALGSILPEDIQKKVDEGYVDGESAAELAQQRATSQDAQYRLEREQFNNQQAMKQVEQGNIRTAVDEWESEIRRTDVDYAQKEEQIRNNARSLMAQHGTPVNAEQALQLSKDAYEMTNKFVKQAAPPPRAISPGPASRTVPNAHAEPKSMMDAVRIGLRNAHTQ